MLTSLPLAAALLFAAFTPSVRIDRENRPNYGCFHAAIALGPAPAANPPVYAVIQDDSMAGIVTKRSDIIFQKSTDRGATWLAQDILIRRGSVFACYPDIITDAEGAIYIVYREGVDNLHSHAYIVRSTDGGRTWSTPATIDDNPSPVAIGWARITADAAGNLFAAWNGNHTGQMRIWSAASTDHGATWSPSVRVDDDTVPSGCFHADVAVQPGSNHRLVVASAPCWFRPGQISYHSYFYRSTDLGRTFEPGVLLDSFDSYCGQPHVVADAGHIICDYSGSMVPPGRQYVTESRTLYTPPDSWGPRVQVSNLDSLNLSETNGAKLALSGDGRIHTALMVFNLVSRYYGIFYAHSADLGASWSDRERVNDDSVCDQSDPDIATDSAGRVYVLWQDGRNRRQEIWFAANALTGLAERPSPFAQRMTLEASPGICRGATRLRLSGPASLRSATISLSLYDRSGRRVRHQARELRDSALPLDLAQLPAGMYVARVTAGNETAQTKFMILED